MIPIELSNGEIISFPGQHVWRGSDVPYFSVHSPPIERPKGQVEYLQLTARQSFIRIDVEEDERKNPIKVLSVKRIDNMEACRWLLLNGKEIPEGLQEFSSRLRG